MFQFLTNRISATNDQFKFNDNSAKKIKIKLIVVLNLTIKRLANKKGADINKPKLQIIASIRGYFPLNVVPSIDPNGTPRIPAIIVIIPNCKDTLKHKCE